MKVNGPKVRRTRKRNKAWTIEQLAAKAGVRPETIQRMETKCTCSENTLASVALALEVEPSEFFVEQGVASSIQGCPDFEEGSHPEADSDPETNLDPELVARILQRYEQLKNEEALKNLPAYDIKTALTEAANQTEQWSEKGMFKKLNQNDKDALNDLGLVRVPLIGQLGNYKVGIFTGGYRKVKQIYLSCVDLLSGKGMVTLLHPSRASSGPFKMGGFVVGYNNPQKGPYARTWSFDPAGFVQNYFHFNVRSMSNPANKEYSSEIQQQTDAIIQATWDGELNFEPVESYLITPQSNNTTCYIKSFGRPISITTRIRWQENLVVFAKNYFQHTLWGKLIPVNVFLYFTPLSPSDKNSTVAYFSIDRPHRFSESIKKCLMQKKVSNYYPLEDLKEGQFS